MEFIAIPSRIFEVGKVFKQRGRIEVKVKKDATKIRTITYEDEAALFSAILYRSILYYLNLPLREHIPIQRCLRNLQCLANLFDQIEQ
jgi:hypothetical protein